MSAICPNCQARLSCGCQKRTASNGAQVCSTCLASYETGLRTKAVPVKGNAPTNVKVLYHGPQKTG